MGTVLTHVRRHQPPEIGFVLVGGAAALVGRVHTGHAEIDCVAAPGRLFDEGDMPPTVRVERVAVVVGTAEHVEQVLGNVVPLLAGHLTRFTSDTHRRVGEETLPRGWFVPGVRGRVQRTEEAVGTGHVSSSYGSLVSEVTIGGFGVSATPDRCWYCAISFRSARPVGRRPGRTSQVPTLLS